MSKKEEFLEYVLKDVLREVSGVTARAMFGGYGLYKDSIFFAIITNNKLYFKVDDKTRREYKDYGSSAFSYMRSGKKTMLKSYYELPVEILENPKKAKAWARQAWRIKSNK